MNQQSRTIIDDKWVENELRICNQSDIRSRGGILTGVSLFFVPVFLILTYGIVTSVENTFLVIALCVISGITMLTPVLVNLFALLGHLDERKMINRKEFEVFTCKLVDKSIKNERCHKITYLHFDGFKEVRAKNVYHNLSNNGDEFYIVAYISSNTVKLLYSSKTHEYIRK